MSNRPVLVAPRPTYTRPQPGNIEMKSERFFCKTIYSFHKMGHKMIKKTNHYILLTNVSIKRCIKTLFET